MDKGIFIKLLSHLYPKILGGEVTYYLDKKSEAEQYIKVDFKTLPKIPIISPTVLEIALDKVESDIRKYTGVSYDQGPKLTVSPDMEVRFIKETLIVDPKFQEASDEFALTYKDPIEHEFQRTYGWLGSFKLYPKDVSIQFDHNNESNIINYQNNESNIINFDINVGKIFYDNVELTDKLLEDFINTKQLKEDEETIETVRSSILGIIQRDISDTWNWPVIVEEWQRQVFEPFNHNSANSENMYFVMFDGSDYDSSLRITKLLTRYLRNRGLL